MKIALKCVVLTLIVISANLVALAQANISPNVPDRGVKPVGSYSVSDIENISLTNGNVNLSIPLASLPPIAGGKLSWTVRAVYNSKLWDFAADTNQPDFVHSSPYVINLLQQSTIGGWRIGAKYSIRQDNITLHSPGFHPSTISGGGDLLYKFHTVLTTPDGTEHEMKPFDFKSYTDFTAPVDLFRLGYYKDTPGTTQSTMRYYSFDGSYLYATIDPQNNFDVYLPDGTHVQDRNGVQTIFDTNQNSIQILTTTDSSGVITTQFSDVLTQRSIQYIYDPNGDSGAGHGQVTYSAATGVTETIDISFGTTIVQGLVCSLDDQACGNMASGFAARSLHVVKAIQYPLTEKTGQKLQYSFQYNSDSTGPDFDYTPQCNSTTTHVTAPSKGWGSVSRITMPTGATVDYSYSLDGNNGAIKPGDVTMRPPVETITKKVVTHDGGIQDTWNYNINYVPFGSGTPGTSTVTGPDGSSTTENFLPSEALNQGFQGLVFRTVKSSSSGDIKVERQWATNIFTGADFRDPSGIVGFNPVMLAEYTTATGSTSMISAKTFQYDFNGNMLQENDYDWVPLDPGLPRDANGVPTGVPATANLLRTVTNTYYNEGDGPASANLYATRAMGSPPSPLILDALEETKVGPSDVQYSYDNGQFGTAPTIGNLTSVSSLDDVDNIRVTAKHSYDAHGNVMTTTDPNGNVTTYAYADSTLAQPTSVTVDPNNRTGVQVSQVAYDFSTGLPVSKTDVNGNLTTIDYTNLLLGAIDPFGRPGTVAQPAITTTIGGVAKTGQSRTATTSYFDDELKVATAADLSTGGDGLLKSQTTMDQLHRTIKVETSEDGSTNYSISSQSQYLQAGRITMSSNPTRGKSETTDGWTRTTRDERGRVVEVASFSGASAPPLSGTNSNWTGSVSSSYDANKTTVTDQAGKSCAKLLDALGRLTQVMEDPSGLNYQTSYGHDQLGNVTSVTQGVQTRTFTYDSLSRLRTALNPEQVNSSGTQVATTSSYDNASNLLTKSNPNGTSLTFTYDGLNRVATKTLSTGGAFTYSYDTAPNGRGRLGSVSIQGALGLQVAADGYYYDGYDAIGNVTSGHQVTAGVSYPMTYGYDLAGHMTQQKYPSGRTINTTLDAAGRISDVQQPAATDYATAFTYAATGAVTSMTLGNHLVAHATYNSRQPTLIGLGTSSSDSSVFRLDYGFGTTANNGNVLSEAITIGDGGSSPTVFNQTFSYDSLNRLATAGETQGSSTTNWSRTYNYDRFGNMWVTNFQGVALSPLTPQAQGAYSANTNQFTAVPNSYDASGNQKVDAEGNTYQYDSDNHMTSCTIVATGTGSSYGYDATGHRVWKTVGATSTIFVYNVAGQLIAEYGGSATTNGGTSYLTTDHLGSTRVVTNSSRAVVARHDYLPFGEEVAATIGNRQSIGGYSGLDDTRQKFTGNERDAESTLDYCAARYYSGSLGRFTTADSLGGGASPQSLNLYAYTANNPLRYADPSGHDPISSLQIAPCSDAPMDDGDGSDNPDPHTVTDENGSHGLYSLAYHLTHPGEIPPKPEEVFTLDVFAATQIDPGPSPSSLDTFIGGGNLLEAFLSPPPADNAMVDQFFKSVLVDDVAGAAFSFGGEFFLPELMATAAATGGTAAEPAGKIVTEGIYEFVSSTGEGYVGQSGDIPRRIGEHLASAKLLPKDLSSLRTTEVLGGKTAREVAEQLRIIDLGGKDTLRNMVNPIGRAKANLLPQAARDFLGY